MKKEQILKTWFTVLLLIIKWLFLIVANNGRN